MMDSLYCVILDRYQVVIGGPDIIFVEDIKMEDHRIPENQQMSDTVNNNSSKKKKTGFQGLNLQANIQKGIVSKGFKVPTPIQRKSMAHIMERRDVVICSKTGSGKTGAFVIPMLNILKSHSKVIGSRALVISPTRELALQTSSVIKQLGKYTDLVHCLLIGGHQFEGQFDSLAQNPDIVISTPGRLCQLINEVKLGHYFSKIEILIFDEADYLFEMGFQEQMRDIVKVVNQNRQIVLVSATIPQQLSQFSQLNMKDYIFIKLDKENYLSEQMSLDFILVRPTEKLPSLSYILQNRLRNEQVIIFCSTKYHVELITQFLQQLRIKCVGIYGKLDQLARKEMINNFRNKESQILVVTDLAARGIDIPQVQYVVHYDYPPKLKTFIHRSGRTARAGQSGQVVSFIFPNERVFILDILLHVGRKLNNDQQNEEDNRFARYGKIPIDILNYQIQEFNYLLKNDLDIKRLYESSEKAFKKFIKSREGASKASIRETKNYDFDVNHPDYLETNVNQDTKDLLEQIKNFKPKESYLEIKNIRNKHVDENSQVLSSIRSIKKHTIKTNNKKVELQKQKEEDQQLKEIQEQLIYQEKKKNRQRQGQGNDDDDDENSGMLRVKKKIKKSQMKDFKDRKFYMSNEPSNQTNILEDKNKISNDDIHGYVMDQDYSSQLQNQKRYIWDKTRKRYVFARQSELGKSKKRIDNEDKGQKQKQATKDYQKWRKKNKTALQKVGEQEDKNIMSRTKRDFETKYSRMRYYNNEQAEEKPKQQAKSELKSKQEILKVRQKKQNQRLMNMDKGKRKQIIQKKKEQYLAKQQKKTQKIHMNSRSKKIRKR